MTRHDDFIGHLESYLEEYEGSTPLPDEVRRAVRAQLPSTHQRPAWWPVRRFPEMNSFAKLALAAAAVGIAAVLGFNYLVAPNVGGPDLETAPSPTPTPQPLDQQDGALAPGSYAIDGVIPARIVITVPAGWEQLAVPATIWSAQESNANLGFETVDNVVIDPCDPAGGLQDPPVGPTVDDLVAALSELPGLDATTPTDVTIAGFAGTYVELTAVSDCPDASGLWECCNGTEFVPAPAPREVRRMWVLDVDGDRLVIASNVRDAASSVTEAGLQQIIDSIRIEAP